MKTVSANLKSHIAQEVTTLCTCWLATRKDGQAFGFTNFSDSLTVDGMIYAADSGHSPSAVQTSSGLAVDNLEVAGILSSASITEADIMAGKWDYAVIEIFKVNRADLTQGRLHLRKGWLGEIKFGKAGFIAELRGLTQAYQQIVGNVYTAACRANLGDAKCGVALAGFTVSGTLTAVTSNRQFSDSSRTEAANFFQGGKLTWLSGLNVGLAMEVQASTVGGFTLHLPMPYPVAVGDTYSVYRGCDKLFSTCGTVFSNQANFRGFPHIPGLDRLAAGT